MTYVYSKEQHTAKIKAGLETAKKKGKKLGRPKGGKIKGEDEVIDMHRMLQQNSSKKLYSHKEMSHFAGVSIGTVQKIINKYKNNVHKKNS